jgi:hypothetical protein
MDFPRHLFVVAQKYIEMRNKTAFFPLLTLFFLWISLTSFLPKTEDEPDLDGQSLVFNTDGLYFAEFYDYIFRGHFENVDIKREDVMFPTIFGEYLKAFGAQCPSALPADKVEIMKWVCAREQVTTNGYGIETSRVCIDWELVGTGLYARRDLYHAKLVVEKIQSDDALRTTLTMMTDPNAMGNSLDMVHRAKGLQNDMAQIFLLNPCNSAGLRRFEENLKRFALNEPAIRMEGASKYTLMKESGGPTGAQDLGKLVEDLVADQARTWAFNRFEAGSISGVSTSEDGQGRPRELRANYRFRGFSGSSAGSVRIVFENGLPKCIYFFDFPQNCKTPNSGILAAYAQGKYAR